MQGSHAFYYSFSAISWTAAGMSEEKVAWLWAVGVIAEVVFFYLSAKIFRHFGALNFMIIAGLAGVVRWLLMSMTLDFAPLIAVQLLHAATFAAAASVSGGGRRYAASR